MIRTIFLSIIIALTATAPAFADWAVFASPKGELMIARGYGGIYAAKEGAQSRCAMYHMTCTLLLSGHTYTCFSIMVAKNGKWATGTGHNQKLADKAAQKQCDLVGGGPCEVKEHSCFG